MDCRSSMDAWLAVHNLPRMVVFLLVAVSGLGPTARSFGQLRSGRGERVLYQEELAEQRAGERRGSVEPASGQSRRSASGQVVSAAFTDADSVVQPSIPMSASCEGCGSCDACDGLPYEQQIPHGSAGNYGIGCGASGCDGMRCNTCRGGYSWLAPTVTTACPPGCGPLMALWYRLSVRAEVPLYWRRDQGSPILVTTSPAGTGADTAGRLGIPGDPLPNTTSILFGNSVIDDQATAGVRLNLSTWLDPQQCWGLMFRYWNAGDHDVSQSFDSNSFPILARPFLNTEQTDPLLQPDAQLIAFPGDTVGSVRIDASSAVDGLELMLRKQIYQDRFTRVDGLFGYQHMQVEEGLVVFSDTTVTGNLPPLQGANIQVTDRFHTENEFNGVAYGLMSSRHFACWKMETMFRLGAGNLRRKVNISGTTVTSSGGASNTETQGLLARNTNSQPFVDDTFVVLPEAGINFAYCIRPGLDFNIGYNYLLLPKVAQAAQQIDKDLAVNASDPLVGALDPKLVFDERRFWLHSLGLGVQLRY